MTMGEYVLTTCSTADMSKGFFDEMNIPFACFHYRMNGIDYPDDLGQTMSFDVFYKEMEKAMPVTSQVNSEEFIELFEPYLKEGKDILHISLSSGISGTANSAHLAAAEMSEKYPDRIIKVVDSLSASSGLGLFVSYLADMKREGKSLEELYEWAQENKLYVQHWFFSTDLTSFRRGGRITGTEAMLGTMLGICPLMNMNNQGKLIPRKKIRTKRKVIEEIVKVMEEHAQNGSDYDGKCFISHSACYEDARKTADLIEEKFPKLRGKVVVNNIGTTIGSHTGPGTVALFYMGDMRDE